MIKQKYEIDDIYIYDLKSKSLEPPLPAVSFLPEVEGSSVFTFSVYFLSVCFTIMSLLP